MLINAPKSRASIPYLHSIAGLITKRYSRAWRFCWADCLSTGLGGVRAVMTNFSLAEIFLGTRLQDGDDLVPYFDTGSLATNEHQS